MNISTTTCKTLQILNPSDIIIARLAVRDFARQSGMNLGDQSRISLATSSLANAMGLGQGRSITGWIQIGLLEEEHRRGVKVACFRKDDSGYVPPLSYFGSERWMVDEFDINTLPNNMTEISMIKWISG